VAVHRKRALEKKRGEKDCQQEIRINIRPCKNFAANKLIQDLIKNHLMHVSPKKKVVSFDLMMLDDEGKLTKADCTPQCP